MLNDLPHLLLRWFGISLAQHPGHRPKNRLPEVLSSRSEVVLHHDLDCPMSGDALHQFERDPGGQGECDPGDAEGVGIVNPRHVILQSSFSRSVARGFLMSLAAGSPSAGDSGRLV